MCGEPPFCARRCSYFVDMAEATARANWAIQSHRAAHDELVTSLSNEPAGSSNPNVQSRTMPAHPADGGGGAYYLLLRRRRAPDASRP